MLPLSLCLCGLSPDIPRSFPCLKPTVSPMTEQWRPTLMPLSVILLPISVSGKTTGVALFHTSLQLHFIGHIGQSIVCVELFKLKIKMNQNIFSFFWAQVFPCHTRTVVFTAANLQGWVKIKYLLVIKVFKLPAVINSTPFDFLYNWKPNSSLLQMGGSLIAEATNSPH